MKRKSEEMRRLLLDCQLKCVNLQTFPFNKGAMGLGRLPSADK